MQSFFLEHNLCAFNKRMSELHNVPSRWISKGLFFFHSSFSCICAPGEREKQLRSENVTWCCGGLLQSEHKKKASSPRIRASYPCRPSAGWSPRPAPVGGGVPARRRWKGGWGGAFGWTKMLQSLSQQVNELSRNAQTGRAWRIAWRVSCWDLKWSVKVERVKKPHSPLPHPHQPQGCFSKVATFTFEPPPRAQRDAVATRKATFPPRPADFSACRC